jgi:hypothetical protein
MRTVIYQSYRANDVPLWIDSCMQTVRQWAASNAFDYEFIDDRLFDRAPPWFRQKAAGQICPITDLARLVVAKEFLDSGYDRTVWVDADIVVFSPERLKVNIEDDSAFCHEIWVEANANGETTWSQRVNNSIAVFAKGSICLDFLIDACQRIARNKHQLGKLDVGTALLSQLATAIPIRLLANVGMFSPIIMLDLALGTERYLRTYAQYLKAPLACANLCSSLSGRQVSGVTLDDSFFHTVMTKCLQSKGEDINRFVQPTIRTRSSA